MSPAVSKDTRLALGASPRVHLLPPEVGDRKRGAAIRRSVVFTVVGALAICALGYGYASYLAIEASAKYDAARQETSALLAEQGQYTDVRSLAEFQQTLTDARQVGALTEVDWSALYGRIVPTLPPGLTIESFSIDAGSPIEDFAVSSLPGDTPRIASATLVANTSSLASAQGWVVALKSLPEYGGARATSIARDDNGVVAVTVVLHITKAALSNRFMPEPEPEPEPEVVADPAALEGEN